MREECAQAHALAPQVYLPSVLLAKKRYVGFKYEYKAQKEPDFDAKGIETVRRDGIAATQKMQETCLKCGFLAWSRHEWFVLNGLLTSQDPLSHLGSLARQELLPTAMEEACGGGRFAARLYHRQSRQAGKLRVRRESVTVCKLPGLTRIDDHSEGRLPPPGAAVATRAMLDDPRAEPEYGERVPYLMFQAEPGQQQVHRAISPEEFLADPYVCDPRVCAARAHR